MTVGPDLYRKHSTHGANPLMPDTNISPTFALCGPNCSTFIVHRYFCERVYNMHHHLGPHSVCHSYTFEAVYFIRACDGLTNVTGATRKTTPGISVFSSSTIKHQHEYRQSLVDFTKHLSELVLLDYIFRSKKDICHIVIYLPIKGRLSKDRMDREDVMGSEHYS